VLFQVIKQKRREGKKHKTAPRHSVAEVRFRYDFSIDTMPELNAKGRKYGIVQTNNTLHQPRRAREKIVCRRENGREDSTVHTLEYVCYHSIPN